MNRSSEESKVCKNLNETYKEALANNSGERSNKTGLEVKDYKDARKLAKLNKQDHPKINNAFTEKISNKLGIPMNPKLNLAQQREVVKRAMLASQEHALRTKEAANGQNGNESMIVENIGEQQPDTPVMNGQMESLTMNLEDQDKMGVEAGTLFAKRDPKENKWHNKTNVNKENIDSAKTLNKTMQFGMVTRSKQQDRAFTKPESKTPKAVRVVPRMGSEKTRGSSVASNESSAQKRNGSAVSCRSEPAVNKAIRKMNLGTKSAGRVDNKAIAKFKGKELSGLRNMNSDEKRKPTSSVLSGSVVKIKEENQVLKHNLDKQREEIDEMSKENGELVRRLEAIENEKMRLMRDINNKQQYLTDKEVEIEGIRKQLVLCKYLKIAYF